MVSVRDVLVELVRRWGDGHPVGIATVVGTWRSAPRQPGATMLVDADGTVVGSVSGGCVEGAVYELCEEAIRTGEPRAQRYGISDDDAFEVGLTCGGIIDLFVERVDRSSFPELGDVAASIESGKPVAVVTCVAGPGDRFGGRLVLWPERRSGTLGSSRLDDAVTDDARGLLAGGLTQTLHYGRDGERRGDDLALFVASYAPRPRLLVFGAIDFAAAVARVGAFLGYRVSVCDARPVFATPNRFPKAEEVVVDWPHRYLAGEIDKAAVDARTVICVLTHDPSSTSPCSSWPCAAIRLRRRDGVTTYPRRPDEAAAGGRGVGGGHPSARVPNRARPGRPYPRGDGHQHRGRDHRFTLGRRRRPAGRTGRPHPPRKRAGRGLSASGVYRPQPINTTESLMRHTRRADHIPRKQEDFPCGWSRASRCRYQSPRPGACCWTSSGRAVPAGSHAHRV